MYNPYSLKNIKFTLLKYGAFPLRQLGQNFLFKIDICERIAKFVYENFSSNSKKSKIIEIGSGLGSLTISLAKYFDFVVCIEIDKIFTKILKDNLESKNVEVINCDALKFNFNNTLSESCEFDLNICSNLPYYIASKLLYLFFLNSISKEGKIIFKSITVMMQKELSERLIFSQDAYVCGFSRLGLLAKIYSEPVKLFEVSNNNFYPKPNVDSVVINFKIIDKNFKIINDIGLFLKVIKVLFLKKRKMIVNTLSKEFSLSKSRLCEEFNKIDIRIDSRVENLNFKNFLDIYKLLEKFL